MGIIKKAVFPVAGLGSRFLPVTKASPKEMLPIVDKPLIQYAVEEAIRAGMTHMIFITSSSKRAIEDHFDKQCELEMYLLAQGKQKILLQVQDIAPTGVHFTYIRQPQPLGLGHAILCAEPVIGNDPFAVLLADDLIDDSTERCLSLMAEYFEQDAHSIVAVQEVPKEEVNKYGMVNIDKSTKGYAAIRHIIEKPTPDEASSNLVAVGRYIFTPTIFSYLRQISADHRGEFQLTDAIACMLSNERVQALQFHGCRYDCGSKLGYLEACVEFGMKHSEVGADFTQYLSKTFQRIAVNRGECQLK